MTVSDRAKGGSKERDVQHLLERAGWRAWRPGKAFRRAVDPRTKQVKFFAVPQDVWGAFDILAIRKSSPVLGVQVGTQTAAAAKRRQVEQGLGAFFTVAAPIATHLRPQVWVWKKTDELGYHYEVWEYGLSVTATPRGVQGARVEGQWIRLCGLDSKGMPLVGQERLARWLWALIPEDPPAPVVRSF